MVKKKGGSNPPFFMSEHRQLQQLQLFNKKILKKIKKILNFNHLLTGISYNILRKKKNEL